MNQQDGGQESDQLPEEGPGGQVVDDDGSGERAAAKESPGHPGENERATGNQPDEAGDDPAE